MPVVERLRRHAGKEGTRVVWRYQHTCAKRARVELPELQTSRLMPCRFRPRGMDGICCLREWHGSGTTVWFSMP